MSLHICCVVCMCLFPSAFCPSPCSLLLYPAVHQQETLWLPDQDDGRVTFLLSHRDSSPYPPLWHNRALSSCCICANLTGCCTSCRACHLQIKRRIYSFFQGFANLGFNSQIQILKLAMFYCFDYLLFFQHNHFFRLIHWLEH